jgi:hypothetical protein
LGSRFRSGVGEWQTSSILYRRWMGLGGSKEVKDLDNPVGIYMEETPGNRVLFGFFRLSSYMMVWGRVVVPLGTT